MHDDERDARIEQVVDLYLHVSASSAVSPVTALLRAGVSLLHSDGEIHAAGALISSYTGSNPLDSIARIPGLSLKEFFRHALAEHNDLSDEGSIRELADRVVDGRIRERISVAAALEQSRLSAVMQDHRAAAAHMAPLIALLRRVQVEVADVPGIRIQCAEFSEVAEVYAEAEGRSTRLRFSYQPEHQRYRIQRTDGYAQRGFHETLQYVGGADEAADCASDVVGTYLGARRSQ